MVAGEGDTRAGAGAEPRTTMEDVAREAGVSKGTVSRVMNGRNWVKPATRDAVLEAMRRTGFVANATARSLAMRRTDSVALVLGAPATRLFENPNYSLLLQVITDELALSDYSLIFMSGARPADRDRLARFLRGGHVDGVILLSAGEPEVDELIRLLQSQPIPVMVSGHPFPDGDPLPFVAADDVAGSVALGRHFVDRGYRRIGVIASHLEAAGARIRVSAFVETVGARTEPQWLVEADEFSHDAGRAAMLTLHRRAEDLDAVFAVSDALAAGVITAAGQLGLQVPADLAVAGFDDSVIAGRTTPPLTTVRQDVGAVGRELVRQLLLAIGGAEIRSIVLPVELVIRDSA
ncbi:LacI family DNA-binding transcriptional regulator [Dactylosporangium matsuzakiense]|uniref:LacI family transcriptional regulator n=1 Tax=Dactylosporangium matsuzakiense TaxID=53360 RepID=A0A9W6KWV6_9ACTN|nr:LacI family DNA-binding transcriptional regulator [Dactylosporangium matsuzakiense]GLL08046.1 LacI family transcriptional regulator [Dactylosporangium matsuzakiense]